MRSFTLALAVLVSLVAGACGPKHVFRLSQDENNAVALKDALARRQLPTTASPINGYGTPRVFVLAAGSPKTILAYDLDAGNVLWKVDADVQSRIWVGGDFIIALEGKQLVARDQSKGSTRWSSTLAGTFVGAAADRERAYVVTKEGNTWWLAALDGTSGRQLWRADATGQLGAPAAQGGMVYVPFLSQWLSIVDGKTGAQLTRIRGVDEQISTLRVTSQVVYYGSKQGVFRLDERSASGKRSDSTYGQVKIPSQLERTTYSRDAYDPVQQGYTAADRARVLWSSEPSTSGPMQLTGGGYAIHYFRYVLGFDRAGELAWAYSNPRVELVASEHTGVAILGLSASGEIVAIDPSTGAVRAKQSLGITSPVLGGTFDADGWAPASQSELIETVPALVQIARDRDARFDRVKELAVSTLAKLPGAQVTTELLALLADPRAPQRLKDTVVDLLVQRKDPASLPVLTAQLAVMTDYIAQTEPEALGPVAKAISGLDGAPLDPKSVGPALAALERHLEAPNTGSGELVQVIAAMAAIGRGAELAALSSHLLLYRSDDDRGDDASWQKAIVTALVAKGGPAERVLLRHVAQDPRTRPGLVTMIRDTMGQD